MRKNPEKMVVYHGTDEKSARNIAEKGIRIEASSKGYFGMGFYTTPNAALAKSNYADFADDDDGAGVVLAFEVSPQARLLDLRRSKDWDKWAALSYEGRKATDLMFRDDFHKVMQSLKIDGLYDESFEGWVFYNPKVLTLVRANPMRRRNPYGKAPAIPLQPKVPQVWAPMMHPLSNPSYRDKWKKEYGIGEDPAGGFFILPDGAFLLGRVLGHDHRNIVFVAPKAQLAKFYGEYNGTTRLMQIIMRKHKLIRWIPEGYTADIVSPPTRDQIRVLEKLAFSAQDLGHRGMRIIHRKINPKTGDMVGRGAESMLQDAIEVAENVKGYWK